MIPSDLTALDYDIYANPKPPSSAKSSINLGLMDYDLFAEPAIANNAPNDLSFMFVSWISNDFV